MEWYIPLLIFCARIIDVSIGTIRMILILSGHRWIAAALGFVEVLVWVFAVGGAIKYLEHWPAAIAFAGGFATGTIVGMFIEGKLALGFRVVRVINANQSINLSALLRDADYRVTRIEGTGKTGPVEIAFLVVRRRVVPHVLKIMNDAAPDAFITIERADHAAGPAFQTATVSANQRFPWGRFGSIRK